MYMQICRKNSCSKVFHTKLPKILRLHILCTFLRKPPFLQALMAATAEGGGERGVPHLVEAVAQIGKQIPNITGRRG